MQKDDYLDQKTIKVASLLHDELLLALAERATLLAVKHELEMQHKDIIDRIELLRMIGNIKQKKRAKNG